MRRSVILKTLLAFAVLIAPVHPVWAQFDSNSKSSGDDDLTKDFGNDINSNASSQAAAPTNNDGVNDFEKPSDISKSDLLPVSSALKNRSEPQLLKAASSILSRDPSQLETLNALAVFYFEDQKYGLAKIILERALKDHPKEPALYNNLGIVYLAEGDMQRALDSFRKSIDAKADYRIGATNLSSIYLEYRDYQRGLAPLEASYEATHSDLRQGAPYAVSIANNYGVALMGVGDNSKAADVFSEIMDLNQNNPTPILNYAILLVEVLKKKNDAIRVLSKLKFMTDDPAIQRRASDLERELEPST